MPAATHLLLPYKRTQRYAGRLTFLSIAGIGAFFYWVFSYEVDFRATIPVIGALLAGMLVSLALPLLKPRLSASDGIGLDARGLTFSRKGRVAQWGWDEISDLRLRSRLHPARLFLGRFMSFRVPADERKNRFGFLGDRIFLRGATVAIGDDYDSRLEDIRSQIDFFREPGGQEKGRPGGGAPDPAWTAREDRKRPKFWHIASFVLAPAIGVALGPLIMDGLPDNLDLYASLESILDKAPVVLASLPLILIVLFKQESVQDNMLSMSAGGLSVRHKTENRHWRWSDLDGFQITESVSRGKDGATARVVGFRALHDGSEAGEKVLKLEESPSPVSCSIEDTYEMPVDEIARRATSWAEWSGRTFGHNAIGVADGSEAAESAISDGISYRRSPGQLKDRHSLLEGLLPWAWMFPMTALAGLSIWDMKSSDGFLISWLPWWGMIIGFVLIFFVPLIGVMALMSAELNRLDLSEDGLRMRRLGQTSRWAWSEIQSLELRMVRTKWSAKQRAVLTIGVPAARLGSRYLRWAHNLDGLETLAVIEDTYDTPLDDIQATLADYRRRYSGRARNR